MHGHKVAWKTAYQAARLPVRMGWVSCAVFPGDVFFSAWAPPFVSRHELSQMGQITRSAPLPVVAFRALHAWECGPLCRDSLPSSLSGSFFKNLENFQYGRGLPLP